MQFLRGPTNYNASMDASSSTSPPPSVSLQIWCFPVVTTREGLDAVTLTCLSWGYRRLLPSREAMNRKGPVDTVYGFSGYKDNAGHALVHRPGHQVLPLLLSKPGLQLVVSESSSNSVAVWSKRPATPCVHKSNLIRV